MYNDGRKFSTSTGKSDPEVEIRRADFHSSAGSRTGSHDHAVVGRYVEPEKFYKALSRLMDDDAVFVADVGQNQIWSCRYTVIRQGRFLTSGGMGTMGYAIPAAIGARVAAPDKQVIAVCGDGAFAMSMMELATMRQEKAWIKVVVLTNRRLGMVREYQHYNLQDREVMVRLENEPDLEILAKAYGISYGRIDGAGDLDRELNTFLIGEEAGILEVMIDPDATTPHA